jgi:hypothetical protein
VLLMLLRLRYRLVLLILVQLLSWRGLLDPLGHRHSARQLPLLLQHRLALLRARLLHLLQLPCPRGRKGGLGGGCQLHWRRCEGDCRRQRMHRRTPTPKRGTCRQRRPAFARPRICDANAEEAPLHATGGRLLEVCRGSQVAIKLALVAVEEDKGRAGAAAECVRGGDSVACPQPRRKAMVGGGATLVLLGALLGCYASSGALCSPLAAAVQLTVKGGLLLLQV